MPELPEVETTVKSLNILKNKKVINVDIHVKKLRYLVPFLDLKNIINHKITNLRRIAKYIIIDLDIAKSVIIHLGMSGRLKISNINVAKNKHDHFVIIFYNKKSLVFNDQRTMSSQTASPCLTTGPKGSLEIVSGRTMCSSGFFILVL